MEGHITAVAALSIGLSILGIIIAFIIFAVIGGIGVLTNDPDAALILISVGSAIGIFLTILSIPGIIGGIGLLKRREWARILVLVTSAIQLMNIPIGTAVGAYSIWVLVQKETVRIFNPILPVPSA
jgi:hypothetical protein